MEINRKFNKMLIENANDRSGDISIEWSLEAIAVALYRIANALEALVDCECEENARRYLDESVKIFGSEPWEHP